MSGADRLRAARDRVLANRAVSVPVLTARRFFEIGGLRKASLLAFNLFICVIPLAIITFAAVSSIRRNVDLGNLMVTTFELRGETAQIVRDTFASNRSILGVASVIAIASFAISGFDAASAFQATFAEAWRTEPVRGWRGALRGGAWFVLVFATFALGQILQRVSARHWWGFLIAVPLVAATNFAFWDATPRLMLNKHLDREDLRPGAILGMVTSTALWAVALIVLPGWFDWYGRGFGAIGIALALLSWTYIVAVVWVATVVACAAWWERTATMEEVVELAGSD